MNVWAADKQAECKLRASTTIILYVIWGRTITNNYKKYSEEINIADSSIVYVQIKALKSIFYGHHPEKDLTNKH